MKPIKPSILKRVGYVTLSIVKATGSAFITLASLIVAAMLLEIYAKQFAYISDEILNIKMVVFWAVVIFDSIINYKAIVK